jgi:cell division transport system permease protein
MRIRLLFSEALRSIAANASTTVAATMTVLIGMFLLGLFVALGTWVLDWSDHAKDQLKTRVYFCTDDTCKERGQATAAEIDAARRFLVSLPEVREVDFISKDEAYEIMRDRRPELVEGLPTNPFPHAFEVTPKEAEDVKLISSKIRSGGLAGVESVNDGEKVADRILQVGRVVSAFFLVAVIVLAAASTMLIANTIRLSIFARRREIEVMKLVGATNWFVRGPFMIEGLLCGLAGSVAAVLLLVLGNAFVLPSLKQFDDTGVDAIKFAWNAAILIAVGLLLGAAGSGLTLRRFLRV